jgi:hypothetical protein
MPYNPKSFGSGYPGSFNPFYVTRNVIFSEAWDQLPETIPEEWTFEDNYIR